MMTSSYSHITAQGVQCHKTEHEYDIVEPRGPRPSGTSIRRILGVVWFLIAMRDRYFGTHLARPTCWDSTLGKYTVFVRLVVDLERRDARLDSELGNAVPWHGSLIEA